MIVVIIMGLVYTLAIHNWQNIKDPVTLLSLQNLKKYLNSIPHTKSVELLCLDDCSSCDIFIDGQKDPDIESIDELVDDSIKIYKYDFYLGLQEQNKKVYFNEENIEENVCFSLSVDQKGVSEQVLVLFKDKVYDYSTYFSPTPVYNSLEEFLNTKDTAL
jgi:hypothetical protein